MKINNKTIENLEKSSLKGIMELIESQQPTPPRKRIHYKILNKNTGTETSINNKKEFKTIISIFN